MSGPRMEAVVCPRYGPPEVLRVAEAPLPDLGHRDLLIRIGASTLTPSDCFIRSAIPSAPLRMRVLMRLVMGVRRPRRAIPGGVLAGKVEAVGSDVRRFRIGDRVIASTGLRLGCHAQFTRVREDGVLVLAAPRLNDDENACLVYGGMIALHFLEKGQVHRRHSVLVYGASGAVGTAAVQLAKHFGSHVTAVCSTRNLELVSSLGADAVLDYTSTDALPVDQTFDLVLDAAGRRKTSALKKACEEALAPGGRLVSIDDGLPGFTAERLALLAGIAQAGALRPVIDRRYALDEIVAAHRYVEQGHKRGNVVLTMW